MTSYPEVGVNLQEASQRIKLKALSLGFSACGIAPVHALKDDAQFMERWLRSGNHGTMTYLERYAEQRKQPELLVENARSVIVVLHSYLWGQQQPAGAPKMSKYTYGEDYHYVVKQKLQQLSEYINQSVAPMQGRAFCDTAPVFERRWAQQAGLGWIGTNKCLINPQLGSFFVIGELIVDLEIAYDLPLEGDCGNCGLCVEACPTHALTSSGEFDAIRCISYQTIEAKEDIPDQLRNLLHGYVAGCDICQDVCPWNRISLANPNHTEAVQDLVWQMSDADWHAVTNASYKKLVKHSALRRISYKKLRMNLQAISPSFFNESNGVG
jgi:epoxyqueuosine reductase